MVEVPRVTGTWRALLREAGEDAAPDLDRMRRDRQRKLSDALRKELLSGVGEGKLTWGSLMEGVEEVSMLLCFKKRKD